MLKRIFIKTALLLFLTSNMFANANDITGMSGISEAAGNSAQAAADQLSSDAGKVAANLESATEALGEAQSDINKVIFKKLFETLPKP